MEVILPNKFYIIPNFLSDSECKELMAFIDERATHDIPQYVQKCFTEQNKNPSLRSQMWGKMIPHANELGVSRCREALSLVRYETNASSIKVHRDRHTSSEKFGVLVYINDRFPDGRTIFYNNGMTILHEMVPKAGTAVVFDIDTPHRAMKPDGVKYICLFRLCVSESRN